MAVLTARQGRQLQRYNKEGGRLVVGCIPYRNIINTTSICNYNMEEEEEEEGIEVLVITSQKSEALMFPKRGWELDETLEQAAKREAAEEAGVAGELQQILGHWNYRSKRYGTVYEGRMFPMKVTSEMGCFAEMETRKKKWVSIAEARRECRDLWMRDALELLLQRVRVSQRSNSRL